VHFFATWCEPCVREIDSLHRLGAATRGRPLAIIAIDVAEVDLRVRAFFEKFPAPFTVLLDRDRAVSKAWNVAALPTSFVLDASLNPRFFVEGDLDWSSPKVLAAIEPLYATVDQPSRLLPKQIAE
jgi:thiol-disulfide isomerase/thioredoxin